MADEKQNNTEETELRPFISEGRRRDLAAELARGRIQAIDDTVNRLISEGLQGLDPDEVKLDGKNGAVEGTLHPGSIVAIPWGPPPLPPKVPKGKETKESKEAKEGKEGKEAKDVDEVKPTGGEGSNAIFGYGDPVQLDWTSMNQVAATHPERLEELLKNIKVI